MDQEGRAYEWAKEMSKSCPGIESLSRAEFMQMYKGPMKTVLDAMAKHLRSEEDADTIRIRTRMLQMKDLYNRKIDLELKIQKLQNEKEESLRTLNILGASNDASVDEAQMQGTFFKAYAELSNVQIKAVQGLQQKTQACGQKLSPSVFNHERSEPSSFIFNPNKNKLEPVLKVETRKLMTQLSPPNDVKVAIECVTQMISKYSGDDRWKTLIDLQSELKLEAAKMSEDVDLKKDAEILSNELKSEEAETDVIHPLQRHLDTLIFEHATLMLTRLHRDRDINALELQIKDLYNPDSESGKEVQDAIQSAQTAKLQRNLAKLMSQNRQELYSQSEISRKILQIRNFNQETEIRKNKIIHLMTSMQSASQLAMQLKYENEQRAMEMNADFESFTQLANIMESQLTLMSQQPLNIFFEKQSSSASESSGSSEISPQHLSILEIIHEIEKTKSQLHLLQNLKEVSVCPHMENNNAVERALQSIQLEKQVLEQSIMELKNHLDLEQEFQSQKLADLLQIWKENPVLTAFLQNN